MFWNSSEAKSIRPCHEAAIDDWFLCISPVNISLKFSEVGGNHCHNFVVARYSSQASGNDPLALPEEVVENALQPALE